MRMTAAEIAELARRRVPGSRRSRVVSWVAAVIAAGALVFLQNFGPVRDLVFGPPLPTPQGVADEAPIEAGDEAREEAGEEAEGVRGPAVTPPGGASPGELIARLAVRLGEEHRWVLGPAEEVVEEIARSYSATSAEEARVAIVAGEALGRDAAVERLERLLEELDDGEPVAADVRTLLEIYRSEEAETLGEEARSRLVEHHGYFAEVALTFDDAPGSDAREALRSGGALLAFGMVGFGLLLVLVGLAGAVLFVVAVVLVATGRIRAAMPRPEPGGSVLLEVFAVFAAGFLLVSAVSAAIATLAGPEAAWPVYVQLGLQWLLVLTPLWPLLRGMGRRELFASLGLHAHGRGVGGVVREIGCGVVGYIAGVPVFAGAVLATIVLLIVAETVQRALGRPSPQPNAEVLELFATPDPWLIALLVSLVVGWAPLCEEVVFRGALFAHVRSRVGLLLGGLVTAVVFGFGHGYGPLFVLPLIALGFNFAMLRAWRGSVIAPITAHALHNGTVTLVVLLVLGLAR